MKKLMVLLFILSFAFAGGSTPQSTEPQKKDEVVILRIYEDSEPAIFEKRSYIFETRI